MVSADMSDMLLREGVSITLQTRSLGRRDPETGWPVESFANSTISIIYDTLGSTLTGEPREETVMRNIKFWTTDTIALQDRLTIGSDVYEVTIPPEPVYDWQGALDHYAMMAVWRS